MRRFLKKWSVPLVLSSFSTCLMAQTADADYTKGVFIVNEDWYGHQNSTINYIDENGQWVYRVFQKENEGKQLGCTNQYGAIYGGRFYLVAKQAKDPGAQIAGGRFTVCDARTMKCLKQFEFISKNDQGVSNADGRGFLGVDEHKGYIGTSNGIYVYDIDNMEIKGQIKGSGNPEDEGYGSLYRGQVGTMVRVNDYVYAVHQSAGLLVIDADADTLKTVVGTPAGDSSKEGDKWGYGSVVLSKDGNLWLSVSAQSGSGEAAPFFYRLDPATLDTTRIDVPEDFYPPANSWYAWTPDCFCASKQENVLYWNGGPGSWFSNEIIIRYDIDRNEFSNYIDLRNDPDDWNIYGCSFRMHPVTDKGYISLFHKFQTPTYITRIYNHDGSVAQELPMIEQYWFPSLPVFPDNADPVVNPVDRAKVGLDQYNRLISLDGWVTDEDNMEAAIVKKVVAVADPQLVDAGIKNGDLLVTTKGKLGKTEVSVSINSNGKTLVAKYPIEVVEKTGIRGYVADEPSVYSMGSAIVAERCEGFSFVLHDMSGKVVDRFACGDSYFRRNVNVEVGCYLLRGTNGKRAYTFKIMIR